MTVNPIQYTSRTFNTVMNDINSDTELKDTPEWWKRGLAGIMDVLSMYENAIANQSFPRSAFTRLAVSDLLALIDYYLDPKATSSGILLYYLDAGTSFPKTILVEDLGARSQGTIVVSSRKYEARSAEVMASTSEGFVTDFAVDNNLDIARVYITGEKVQVATDNTLPSPLAASTDYYVIYVSDTEIVLATSLANAYAGTEITLLSDGVGNHTIDLFSVQVTSYQQETQDQYTVGRSDGISSWQKFDLQFLDVVEDTLEVTINSVSWDIVDSLVYSTSTDTHCLLRYNTDNSSYVLFGDGTYGKIPGNFDVLIDHATGGGLESNISKIDKINVYAGSDSDVLGVSNPSAFTGGSEVEDIETAKVLGPLLLKARDRFVTSDDAKALSLSFGGITRVAVLKNLYGLLSAGIAIVPSGGGLPSSALKTSLQTYLIDRTILESVDTRVIDPTYVTVTPVSQIKVDSGYTFAGIKNYVMLAFDLLFSEVTSEYKADYLQNGVASVTTLINAKWSFTFTISDYPQIERLISNVTATDFGESFQESDVFGFVDTFVYGVDYLTVSSPAFPIVVDDDEISTDDVLTGNITEIP